MLNKNLLEKVVEKRAISRKTQIRMMKWDGHPPNAEIEEKLTIGNKFFNHKYNFMLKTAISFFYNKKNLKSII